MKKLVSRITIALFVTLSACYPVHAGVGDTYVCFTGKGPSSKGMLNGLTNLTVGFKRQKESGDLAISYDRAFAALVGIPYPFMKIVETSGSENFYAVFPYHPNGISSLIFIDSIFEYHWHPIDPSDPALKYTGRCIKQ